MKYNRCMDVWLYNKGRGFYHLKPLRTACQVELWINAPFRLNREPVNPLVAMQKRFPIFDPSVHI
jgi:hypothetical protein